ncbi:unnamed protein product [Caenorhabditis bovis]|uniref:F-box domain-containing protein n=1 Tax=Caenorhabditis bovis TaxID=2654633 RepID=A0A8S1FCZ2_9PELO|nr:unnamed protein product [Caenorhabditis bovis]
MNCEMSAEEPMDYSEISRAAEWIHLPIELKEQIMRLLPFQDKQNMMLVNRECAKVCDTLPNKLREISILEMPSTAKTTLTIMWKNERGRLVSRMVDYRGDQMHQTDCPPHTAEAMKVFVKILKRAKVKTVTIEIPCFEGLQDIWDQAMNEQTRVTVKYFNIRTNDYRLVKRALQCARNSKHEISLLANDSGAIETEIFDMEKIKQARSVILWSLVSNIQDHQLISLNAHNIRISSEFITSQCIIQMLTEWKDGRRKLERLHISSPLIDYEEITKMVPCVCWKNLTDICQLVWREVDEEGYLHAIRGPSFDVPAAIGIINLEGVQTFIFRIIKINSHLAELICTKCSPNSENCNNVQQVEQAAN